jgi:hypothetical protein
MDSKQSRANKRKGASFEIDLEQYFRWKAPVCAYQQSVSRIARAGKLDRGDLALQMNSLDGTPVTLIIEAKNAAKFTPSEWVDEAAKEAENYKMSLNARDPGLISPVVIAKRRNRPLAKAFVIMELEQFSKLVTMGKERNDKELE